MAAVGARPVVFGEVLFDQFEDGDAVLGGAPFNVAWHLQGLGLRPFFASRIGEDRLGERVREAMADWGMDTAGVQVDAAHPTGTVRVTLQGGQPSYEIVPHQAYDRIELTDTLRGAVGDEGGLLYHGSLIARSDVSRETLEALRARNPVAVFVDVNLRAPWWSREGIERLIHGARWLKLNEHELGELVGAASVTRQRMPELARSLMRRHGVAFAIVTCGAEGAVLVTEQATHDATPVPVEEIVDTVGAGDGFSAVALFGLTAGWPPEVILQRALAFAAEICRMRGATTTDHSLYDRFLDTWNA